MHPVAVGGAVVAGVAGLGCWVGYRLVLRHGRLLLRIEELEAELAARCASAGSRMDRGGLTVGAPSPDFRRMGNGKFLLVKGREGLGNRMLCASTAILYARLTGRRLLVDWSDPVYSDGSSNAFHHLFRCPLSNPSDQIPVTDSVDPAIWRGHLRESAQQMEARYCRHPTGESWRQFSADLSRSDHEEELLVMWNYTAQIDALRGHFRGGFAELHRLSDEAILTRLLRVDLQPAPAVRERVAQFKARHFGKPTIGVHVRYSDERADLRSILKQVNALIKQRPSSTIFLATDSREIKKLFEAIYRGVISTSHWYPPPGWTAHGSRACRDRLQNGVEAVVDLYLLAECDQLVIDTSSSFSKVAQLLAVAPAAHVFDVASPSGEERPRRPSWYARRCMWLALRKVRFFTWGPRILRVAVGAGMLRGDDRPEAGVSAIRSATASAASALPTLAAVEQSGREAVPPGGEPPRKSTAPRAPPDGRCRTGVADLPARGGNAPRPLGRLSRDRCAAT